MQSSQPLNPQLAEIKNRLDAASQKAASIVESVGFGQLNVRLQPDEG